MSVLAARAEDTVHSALIRDIANVDGVRENPVLGYVKPSSATMWRCPGPLHRALERNAAMPRGALRAWMLRV